MVDWQLSHMPDPDDLNVNDLFTVRVMAISVKSDEVASVLLRRVPDETSPYDLAPLRTMVIRSRPLDGDQRDTLLYVLAQTGLAIAEQLASVDDALRNTIGGAPRGGEHG